MTVITAARPLRARRSGPHGMPRSRAGFGVRPLDPAGACLPGGGRTGGSYTVKR
ncbi:hypothetical protein OV450_2105 [Actinobacteria bacterium OV450]|nr:hypothetical protein OV450_2105 [Actinobacteria bacterium OV450]